MTKTASLPYRSFAGAVLVCLAGLVPAAWVRAQKLEPLKYNNPGLEVNLGVGLWASPMPMDYDGDGKMDLVVVSAGKPFNGIYLFQNPGGDRKMPVFGPGVRMANGLHNMQVSYVNGQPRVLRMGQEMRDFRHKGLSSRVKLPVAKADVPTGGRVRADQWRYVDYDGDGVHDLIVGIEDWADYGWDDAFDKTGRWTNGPLHGFVYLLRNTGSDDNPKYGTPVKVEAGGRPIDRFGMPSPCFADFKGNGKLDLICGDFRGQLTYFENVGTRTDTRYAPGRPVLSTKGPLDVDSPMITPVAVDWDGNGTVDLIVGREDGRVVFIENTGRQQGGGPVFAPPRFFRQKADDLKFGVLVSPVAVDWDGDGKQDLVCGNAAGQVGFFKNLGGSPPKWAAPQALEADGREIQIRAGEKGSIQGPAEVKWGYTTLSVADWDGDGLPDLVVNSIWGRVVWYRNVGTRTRPKLAAAQPVRVAWPGATPKPDWVWWDASAGELASQWRTTPLAMDLTGDGLTDLVMLDRDGFLSLFKRRRAAGGGLELAPPRHVFRMAPGQFAAFDWNHKPLTLGEITAGTVGSLNARSPQGKIPFRVEPSGAQKTPTIRWADRTGDPAYDACEASSAAEGAPLRLNAVWAGRGGRRKLTIADWDDDGRPDLLVNSTNVNLLRNVATTPGHFVFTDAGPLAETTLAGHDTSPTVADFDGDGIPDLIVGAEDGRIYYLKNPRSR